MLWNSGLPHSILGLPGPIPAQGDYTPFQPEIPKSQSSTEETQIKFLGVDVIEIKTDGAAELPARFSITGVGTIHYRVVYLSRAISPVPPSPDLEVKEEDKFWEQFEAGEPEHASGFVVSVVANTEGVAHIPLGPSLSSAMPTLRAQGGAILVALRLRNLKGKVIEQTCVVVDPVTSYWHLCSGHNFP